MSDTSYSGRPSVCRNCGAIVAAGVGRCPQCGAEMATVSQAATRAAGERPDAAERAPDPATLRFARALFSRPATFTLLFIVVNVLIHLLKAAAEVPDAPQVALIDFGAKVNALIDPPYNQWWRFVTPIFLHVNLFHLAVNMYGLWMLGPYVERLYGSARFVVIWVLTGVAGVAASYYTVRPEVAPSVINNFLFRPVDVPSAGASGALFGLIGVLFVFGIKFRHELPEGFKRAFGTGMLPTILLNIAIGYFLPFIDNAAHMGGLVAGALLASVIGYKRIGPREPAAYLWHLLQASALLLVVACFALVAHNYTGARPSLDNLSGFVPRFTDPRVLQSYFDATNAGKRALKEVIETQDPARADDAIRRLREASAPDETAASVRDDMRTLLERLRDRFSEPPERRRTKEWQAELTRIADDWNALMQREIEWLNREGGRYGIRVAPEGEPPAGNAPGGSPDATPTPASAEGATR